MYKVPNQGHNRFGILKTTYYPPIYVALADVQELPM